VVFLLNSARAASHAAHAEDQSQSVHSANDTLRCRSPSPGQFADLRASGGELAKVQQQLPPTAAMPALVRSLKRHATHRRRR